MFVFVQLLLDLLLTVMRFLSASGIMQVENLLLPMSMKIPGIVFEGIFKVIFLVL